MPLEKVLERLEGVKRNGGGFLARCPGHDDRHASLSISEGRDGRVLLKCFSGCEFEEIVAALGLEPRDLFDRDEPTGGGGGLHPPEPPRNRATPSPGCTIEQYARAKQLPVEFLRRLGLRDMAYMGAAAVRVPYVASDGSEAAVRFRLDLEKGEHGDRRFRWKSGAKPCLYGLDRLEEARKAGSVVLVEGESDCHTLWHHGISAIGIAGASSWNESRDAGQLEGVDRIFVVVEPDKGGEAVTGWLSKSSIRDRAWLVDLGERKDPSGLYLDDPGRFEERFQAALDSAEPWRVKAAEVEDAESREAWATCGSLAREARILDHLALDLRRSGLVGEERAAKLVYLATTSRLLERIVSIALKGPSSGGKSVLVERVLRFFPGSAAYELSAMSEHALAYSEEPLDHRMLVLYEAAGLSSDFQSYLLRSLLSEGRVRYETVEKTAEGLRARLIEREGPTGLIVTTTAVRLHPENETRLLSITVTDTREQTSLVMAALAEEEEAAVDLEPWHALQWWLEGGEHSVTIPFARDLAGVIPPVAVRLRRDFSSLLALVRAHAFLHRASRERDGQGRIVATLDDYAVVRELVAELVAEGVEATVKVTVRETVAAVAEIAENNGVTQAALARHLKLDKSSSKRRADQALSLGYVRNLEDRKGRPARLVVGDALPEDLEILPAVERLAGGCTVARDVEGVEDPPSPENGEPRLTEDELGERLKSEFAARELPQVGQRWICPSAPREGFHVIEVGEDTARIRHELGGIGLDRPLAEFDGSILRRAA